MRVTFGASKSVWVAKFKFGWLFWNVKLDFH